MPPAAATVPPDAGGPRINRLTGQPFGYRPPAAPYTPPPAPQAPQSPQQQFLAQRDRIEAQMPLYEATRARYLQGQATDEEALWLKQFTRGIEQLRDQRWRYTDNDRTRQMEISQPEQLAALRQRFSLPGMNIGSGTYGYR
jgi:hypothetical protein